jgi:hypothetical protein
VSFQQWSELECQKFLTEVIYCKERDISSMVIERWDKDRQSTPTPNTVDIFGTGITLPDRADVRRAAAGPCRLQLCEVLGSSGSKLSEYICSNPVACISLLGLNSVYKTNLSLLKHSFFSFSFSFLCPISWISSVSKYLTLLYCYYYYYCHHSHACYCLLFRWCYWYSCYYQHHHHYYYKYYS